MPTKRKTVVYERSVHPPSVSLAYHTENNSNHSSLKTNAMLLLALLEVAASAKLGAAIGAGIAAIGAGLAAGRDQRGG